MKKIYFCLNYIDVHDICLTYEETEQDLIKGKECIYTTSMAHFSFDLIEQGYDIYLCYQDKKVKIEPHMDLSGNGEPCKDCRHHRSPCARCAFCECSLQKYHVETPLL